jgi:hypothetical protein
MYNLSNWLTRMVRGNKEDDRPPIWDGVPRERVKAMLDDRVNSNAALVTSINSRFPGFAKLWVEVESDQAKNLGPSSQFVSYLVDGPTKVEAVFSDKPLSTLRINAEASRKALEHIKRLLPARSLRAVSLRSIKPSSDDMSSKDRLDGTTNSGFPAWIRGWGQVQRNDESHIKYREWLYPHCEELIARYIRSTDPEKVAQVYYGTTGQRIVSKGPNPLVPKDGKWKGKRIVIAMPKDETLPAKTVFVPSQHALLEVRNSDCPARIFSGWLKMPTLDKNVQVLLEHAHKHKQSVISGDLSSFDATVPPDIWWQVALAASNWFDDDAAKIFLAVHFSDIYRTGVITPTKVIDPMTSSVKSGSNFTNFDDSLVNLYVQLYGYYSGYYGKPVSMVNGDDIVATGAGMTKAALAQAFADHGMIMNEEKSLEQYDMCHYLQRSHFLGIPGGMGSIYRVLVKCLAVEDDSQLRYDERNKYAYAVQALHRLEVASFNPMFQVLVDLIAAGDKLHLGSNLPAQAVASGAGDYATRVFTSDQRNIWSPSGSGIPFVHWAVNRVLRGEVLPPPGLDRWKAIYGIPYSSVPI